MRKTYYRNRQQLIGLIVLSLVILGTLAVYWITYPLAPGGDPIGLNPDAVTTGTRMAADGGQMLGQSRQ